MKVALLLAGKGRRLKEICQSRHKAFILLEDVPCLTHLLNGLWRAGMTELIPVLGFDSNAVERLLRESCPERVKILPVVNPRYEQTNNLGSLICARSYLDGESFLICNGDLVMNANIIKDLIETRRQSAIAIDDSSRNALIDSPKVKVVDGRIYDLGRHIPLEQSGGYAIGVYKLGQRLSPVFFKMAEKVFAEDQNAGFHDPLVPLFNDHAVYLCSTRGRSWMDIDKKEDIEIAGRLLNTIRAEEGKQR